MIISKKISAVPYLCLRYRMYFLSQSMLPLSRLRAGGRKPQSTISRTQVWSHASSDNRRILRRPPGPRSRRSPAAPRGSTRRTACPTGGGRPSRTPRSPSMRSCFRPPRPRMNALSSRRLWTFSWRLNERIIVCSVPRDDSAVDLYFTTPMTTVQVVEHLGYPTRRCRER